MLKAEWGAESKGKLPHLFIPSKTATLVPEFAVEDLPVGRTAALVPGFAVKDLPLGRTLTMMMMMDIHISIIVFCLRAGLSLQTQHFPHYSLLSLPFSYLHSPFIMMFSII